MASRVRLGAFLVAVILCFAFAFAIGRLVDPADRGSHEPAHRQAPEEHAATLVPPGGPSASVDGFVLAATPGMVPAAEAGERVHVNTAPARRALSDCDAYAVSGSPASECNAPSCTSRAAGLC